LLTALQPTDHLVVELFATPAAQPQGCQIWWQGWRLRTDRRLRRIGAAARSSRPRLWARPI